MKVFSKQKMLERVEQEGLSHLLDQASLDLMDALDGKEALKNDFKALVYDQLEYFVRHGDRNIPVNPKDCIDK